MKKAVLFESLADTDVKCLACSWYCRIKDGMAGRCGTRWNEKGTLYSLVYGKTVGPAMDPIEKKPLYHVLPGAQLLSFGTVGCNFACDFCQNWEQSQLVKKENSLEEKKQHIDRFSQTMTPRDIVSLAKEYRADGIAYTYNEPAIFVEFAHDTAKLAKKAGLLNVFVSNGFESKETLEYMKPYLDAINIDLKSFREGFYTKICKGLLTPVKENIKRCFSSGIETEVTTLLIPGHNDSKKELEEIATFLVGISPDIPWHISAFHPDYLMRDIPQATHVLLDTAYEIGKSTGLRYIYVGNVVDKEKSKTYCPTCHTILITRDDYSGVIVRLDRKTGRCKNCKEHIYGIWN